MKVASVVVVVAVVVVAVVGVIAVVAAVGVVAVVVDDVAVAEKAISWERRKIGRGRPDFHNL